MFNFLKNLFASNNDYEDDQHSQECFIFPIIKKEDLKDGCDYEHFEDWSDGNKYLVKKHLAITGEATWNAKRECFLIDNQIVEYEDYLPIHCIGKNENGLHKHRDPWNLETISYNSTELNVYDIEELRKILYCLVDDNVESDDIYEKLLDWMQKRKLEL